MTDYPILIADGANMSYPPRADWFAICPNCHWHRKEACPTCDGKGLVKL